MSHTKPAYLFANWKMYLDVAESVALAKALRERQKEWSLQVRMSVFPSALAFNEVAKTLADSNISVGAQNVFWHEKGGYTGEVSAPMYQALGASYTIIGHSERRHVFHETNHEINQKIEAVVATSSLTPVLCVGETQKERQDGMTEEAVESQLRGAFSGIRWPAGKELIVAYEPVWAVGTGEACDPAEAERICGLITGWVQSLLPEANAVVLYGGSVKPDNIGTYLECEHISGVLVGVSSTKLDVWLDIVKQCTL